MRWAEQQRQEFIRERLLSGHTINRSDLRAKFKISTPQASIDIQKFQRLNPGAMIYNRTAKTYEQAGTNLKQGRDTTAAAKSLMSLVLNMDLRNSLIEAGALEVQRKCP